MQACEAPIASVGVCVPNRVKDFVRVPYHTQVAPRDAFFGLPG